MERLRLIRELAEKRRRSDRAKRSAATRVENAGVALDVPELEQHELEVSIPAAAIPAEPAAEQELDFG